MDAKGYPPTSATVEKDNTNSLPSVDVDNIDDNLYRDDLNTNRDEAELARLGYKQELKRDLGLLQVCVCVKVPLFFFYNWIGLWLLKNFGMSFSIISVITVSFTRSIRVR